MKRILYLCLSLVAALFCTASCDLTEPMQVDADKAMIFGTESGLRIYAYSFYKQLPTPGNAGWSENGFCDYAACRTMNEFFINGAFTVESSTGWSWTNLHSIRKEKYLSLGEIIPITSLKEMKKKIIKDRLIRDRATVITENDFRTSYDPQTDIQKFNNILNGAKLNSNKSSLIKYLNEKKVDPLTIKILSNQDGDKISKINKMCQTIFQNQDKEKLFNDIVKNKAKQRINNTKKEFQIAINDLGSDINSLQEKLKKYEKKIDNKEKYREYFNEIVIHHWLKKDLERFNKKSTPKPSYLRTFFDTEDMDNSR